MAAPADAQNDRAPVVPKRWQGLPDRRDPERIEHRSELVRQRSTGWLGLANRPPQ